MPDDKITTIGVDFVKTLSILAAGHKFLVYEWCMMMRKFDERNDPASFILFVLF